MHITLMRVNKKINSTRRTATAELEVNCQFKAPCSDLNPEFTLTVHHGEHNINYYNMILADGKYYNITDVTYEAYDVCTVSCSIDVLATYKNDILATTQYVTRCSDPEIYAAGGRYTDTTYIADQTRYHTYTESDRVWYQGPGNTLIVIGLKGVVPQPERLDNLPIFYFAGTSYYMMRVSDFENLMLDIMKSESSQADIKPLQYISCAYIIPANVPNAPEPTNFNFKIGDSGGQTLFTSNHAFISSASDFSFNFNTGLQLASGSIDIPQNPIALNDGYRTEPWETYKLYAGPFGTIEIPSGVLLGHTYINYSITIDLVSGNGYLELTTNAGIIITTAKGQIGIPIELTQVTRNSEIGQMSYINEGVRSVGELVTGNYLGGAVGLSGACISALSNNIPTVDSKGSNGSYIDFVKEKLIFLTEYMKPSKENINVYGRAVFNNVELSSIASGSLVVIDTPVISIPGAKNPEIESIISFMQNGFYIE